MYKKVFKKFKSFQKVELKNTIPYFFEYRMKFIHKNPFRIYISISCINTKNIKIAKSYFKLLNL